MENSMRYNKVLNIKNALKNYVSSDSNKSQRFQVSAQNLLYK